MARCSLLLRRQEEGPCQHAGSSCPSGAGICRHSRQSRPLCNSHPALRNSHPGQDSAGMSTTSLKSKVQQNLPHAWRGGALTSPHSGRVSRRVLSGPNEALTDESRAWLCPAATPDGAATPGASASRAAAEAFSAADSRSLWTSVDKLGCEQRNSRSRENSSCNWSPWWAAPPDSVALTSGGWICARGAYSRPFGLNATSHGMD